MGHYVHSSAPPRALVEKAKEIDTLKRELGSVLRTLERRRITAAPIGPPEALAAHAKQLLETLDSHLAGAGVLPVRHAEAMALRSRLAWVQDVLSEDRRPSAFLMHGYRAR